MLLVPINEVYVSRLYGRLFDAIQKNTFTMNHFYVILGTMMFLQIGFAYSDYFNSKQMTEFQQYCKTRFLNIVFEKFNNNKVEPNPGDALTQNITHPTYTSGLVFQDIQLVSSNIFAIDHYSFIFNQYRY